VRKQRRDRQEEEMVALPCVRQRQQRKCYAAAEYTLRGGASASAKPQPERRQHARRSNGALRVINAAPRLLQRRCHAPRCRRVIVVPQGMADKPCYALLANAYAVVHKRVQAYVPAICRVMPPVRLKCCYM